MKRKKTWILVADGARARIIRQMVTASEEGTSEADLVFEADHRQTREIMSDRPGRSFSSEGTRRSAMEYTSDPVHAQEVQFARTLVDELERHHAAHEFDRLMIVAEPRMLGTLRQKLAGALSHVIVGEVDKDLTRLPRHELIKAVAELGGAG